ncbi:MAG: hypothetical protein VB111_12775 [Clostridiaceae bacterium]|nr:hypothetical protein [Clostridiaceae bacterium]
MRFPSLLFCDAPPERKMPENVPEDLRLTLLLPHSVAPALCIPCAAGDILARQALLRALSSSDARRGYFTKLAQDIDAVTDCYESFSKVRCENERVLSYLGLINAYHTFCRDAANAPDIQDSGVLYTRFARYFAQLVVSDAFLDMETVLATLYPNIDAIRENRIRIRGNRLKVSAEAPDTFEERLSRCAAELGFSEFSPARTLSYVIAPQLIDAIAGLYPKEFDAFREFYKKYTAYFDPSLLSYRLELSFCNEITKLGDRIRAAGIPLTFPRIAKTKKIDIHRCYDITLLSKGEPDIIPNDVQFDAESPFYYLTGANGGGKTTYLRTVGVAALLFLCGCPIACTDAEIYPLSGIFTHFPRDERFDGDGRFADEKKRVAEISSMRGDDSLILLNETYATTSEEIAVTETEKLADELYASGCFGIYITHQHSLGQTRIPYLNVIVDSEDQNRRTYKIARRKGVSGSYAKDILKKYSLTREALNARFPADANMGGNN